VNNFVTVADTNEISTVKKKEIEYVLPNNNVTVGLGHQQEVKNTITRQSSVITA
jgi:hypothetical protein